MVETLETAIKTLVKRTEEATTGEDAARFSQAVLSITNALVVLNSER